MSQFNFPPKINQFITDKTFTIDEIGLSGNQVLIFEDMVLKIEDDATAMNEQIVLLRWLDGKLPVPKVLAYEVLDGKCYLLMSKIVGKMSCDTYYLEHPDVLLEALACGLRLLWSVDISDCPRRHDLDLQLKEARFRVENNLVDVEDAEPTTFCKDGFENPRALLEWLEKNRPMEEAVFSHGDYCLPNIFLVNGKVEGLIDLDHAGIGDRWQDIALCYRSLKHNFDGTYGGKVYKDFNPDMLFEKLEIEPDWEKIRYYILLDELF